VSGGLLWHVPSVFPRRPLSAARAVERERGVTLLPNARLSLGHLHGDGLEFAQLIPVAKGGSCEEHNLRLTCLDCNRKKSANGELNGARSGRMRADSRGVEETPLERPLSAAAS